MTAVRRVSAGAMTLVLAFLPATLERCRTACLEHSRVVSTAPVGAACHETAPDETGGPRMEPLASACGHNEDARTSEWVSAAPGRTRDVAPVAAIQASAGAGQASRTRAILRPPGASDSPRTLNTLDTPLRL